MRIDSGLQDVEDESNESTGAFKRETVEATYFAVPLGNRMLLVKSPMATAQEQYIGALTGIPEETRNNLAKELAKDNRNFSDVFHPFMLDATDFTSWGYGALAGPMPATTRQMRQPASQSSQLLR